MDLDAADAVAALDDVAGLTDVRGAIFGGVRGGGEEEEDAAAGEDVGVGASMPLFIGGLPFC